MPFVSSHASPSPSPIVGRALLVSNDSAAVGLLTNGMRQFAIFPDVCADVPAALGLVNSRKYEAIVVDFGFGDEVVHLLERVRLSPSNQNSVTFAIIESSAHAAPRARSNFVMRKPLSSRLVKSTLRAALGLIIREYRRYFRCPIALPVTIQMDNAVGFACEMINISEGGLAVNTSAPFKVGSTATVRFALPGECDAFDIPAEICWSDNKSRAGLHFQFFPSDQKSRLHDWLSRRIEQGLPEPIARLFQKEK